MALPATKSGHHVRPWNTDEIREQLSRMGVNPIRAHAQIVMDQVVCLACHGSGIARYRIPRRQIGKECECGGKDAKCWRCDGIGVAIRAERTCNSCHGNQREKLTVAAIQSSASELMRYTCQQLKQVDHVSSDGSQAPRFYVEFVGGDSKVVGTSAARLMEPERNPNGD